MSKGGGSAPPAVDPVALGNAQTDANLKTAAQQAALNNVNTFSPFGSSQFTAFGTGPGGIGPAGYNLNTTLNPNIQGVFDAQTSLARTLAGNAGPLGDMATGPAAGGNSLINFGSQGLSTLPSLSGIPGPSSPIQMGLPGTGSNILQNLNFDGLIPISPNGAIQGSLDFGGLTPLSPGSGIPSSATDFSNEVKQAQDAAYKSQTQYLDPQFSQRSSDLTQQLADQGISPGTQAYDRAQGDLGRERTLAYSGAQNAATTAGNEEQARLFGEDLSAQGQRFGQDLSARQQGAGELQAGGAFANAANQLAFGQGLTTRQQQLAEILAGGQFANQAQQQGFGQQLTGGQFGNEAQNQEFNQAAQRVAALNSIGQQNFSNANAQLGAGEGEFGSAVGNLTGLSPLMDFSGSGTVPTTIGNTSVYPSNIVGAQNSANTANANRFAAQQQQFNSLTNGLGSLGGSLGFGGNGGLGKALGLTGQGGSIFGSGGLFGSASSAPLGFAAGTGSGAGIFTDLASGATSDVAPELFPFLFA